MLITENLIYALEPTQIKFSNHVVLMFNATIYFIRCVSLNSFITSRITKKNLSIIFMLLHNLKLNKSSK